MSISILNTDTANISSIVRCFKKFGVNPLITNNIDECISNSRKIILPGIGNMKYMNKFKNEIKQKLLKFISNENNYLLGICLGAQAMMNYSEESESETLGLISGDCRKIYDLSKINLNIGFRKIIYKKKNNPLLNKLFSNIDNESKFYFLHKYYIKNQDKDSITLETFVDKKKIDCLLIKKNIIAIQFHPELSKNAGEKFLKNFSSL